MENTTPHPVFDAETISAMEGLVKAIEQARIDGTLPELLQQIMELRAVSQAQAEQAAKDAALRATYSDEDKQAYT